MVLVEVATAVGSPYTGMKNRQTAKQIAGESNRRHFLKWAGYGTLGFMTGEFWPLLDQSALGKNTDTISKAGFIPNLDISLILS